MTEAEPSAGTQLARQHVFSVQSVCWGYRSVFQETIEQLVESGQLGAGRERVTRRFFDLLRTSDQRGFDHVLKEIIRSLNAQTTWMLEIPQLFFVVTEIGHEFAKERLHYGMDYFRLLGQGAFGDTPTKVRNLMTWLRRLRAQDPDLAFAFLRGYRRLCDRLTPREIERYIEQGVTIFGRNPRRGCDFMQGLLKSAEHTIEFLSAECRLEDIKSSLESLLRALVGYEVEVADLGQLDSDFLIERGSNVVCMYRWLYLPSRIRAFEEAPPNRLIYMLMGVVAAGMLAEDSFPRIHGHPEYRTCRDVVGEDIASVNLLQIFEYARALRTVRRKWPGARRLVDWGLDLDFRNHPPTTAAERLFFDLASGVENVSPAIRQAQENLYACHSVFETAQQLDADWCAPLRNAYPGLAETPLRTFAFLPDFLYPGEVDAPPPDALVADLRDASKRQKKDTGDAEKDDKSRQDATSQGDQAGEEKEGEGAPTAAFVYDEWCQQENDYYRDYCLLRERRPEEASDRSLLNEIDDEVRKVRRVFERLKPELLRREKHLPEGDSIDHDLLVNYLVQRHKEPSPRIDFYEKPRISRRDLAVLLLLDVSGSTGEDLVQRKVLDVEKHAAVILGEALNLLGDRFSICGFSGSGRKNCEYFIYKELAEDWDGSARAKILSARPLSSTRIGPALRHSGYRLSDVDAKQRLILLITDGRPLDTNYDPGTRYAQYDVRKACEENQALGIATFCISTLENPIADMELMFPGGRYCVASDLSALPRALPKLYTRLTF